MVFIFYFHIVHHLFELWRSTWLFCIFFYIYQKWHYSKPYIPNNNELAIFVFPSSEAEVLEWGSALEICGILLTPIFAF